MLELVETSCYNIVSDKKQHFYRSCHLLTTISPFFENIASFKTNIPNSRLEWKKKHTLFKTKTAIINSWLWPKQLKTMPFGAADTYIAPIRKSWGRLVPLDIYKTVQTQALTAQVWFVWNMYQAPSHNN